MAACLAASHWRTRAVPQFCGARKGAGVMNARGGRQGQTVRRADTSATPLTGRGLVLSVTADPMGRTTMRRRFDESGHDAGAAGVMTDPVILSSPATARCPSGEADFGTGYGVWTWRTKPSTVIASGSCYGAAGATVGLHRRSVRPIKRREDTLLRVGGVPQRGRTGQLAAGNSAERNHRTTISAGPRSTAHPVATRSGQPVQPDAQLGVGRWGRWCPHAGADVSNTSEGP